MRKDCLDIYFYIIQKHKANPFSNLLREGFLSFPETLWLNPPSGLRNCSLKNNPMSSSSFNLSNTKILPCSGNYGNAHDFVSLVIKSTNNNNKIYCYCKLCNEERKKLIKKAKCKQSPTGFHFLRKNFLSRSAEFGLLFGTCDYCNEYYQVDSLGYDTTGAG